MSFPLNNRRRSLNKRFCNFCFPTPPSQPVMCWQEGGSVTRGAAGVERGAGDGRSFRWPDSVPASPARFSAVIYQLGQGRLHSRKNTHLWVHDAARGRVFEGRIHPAVRKEGPLREEPPLSSGLCCSENCASSSAKLIPALAFTAVINPPQLTFPSSLNHPYFNLCIR